jgi:hypothetical protein
MYQWVTAALHKWPPLFRFVATNLNISSLRKLFRDQHDKFSKTGAGVTPLDEHAAANLHSEFFVIVFIFFF